MVEVVKLDSWEAFEGVISRFQQGPKAVPEMSQKLLFRGQPNADWPLSTTLERATDSVKSFQNYYHLIATIKPEIETLTENEWNLPSVSHVYSAAAPHNVFSLAKLLVSSPIYGYLAHLRHHGFPSPLLDWTRSAYVAAFFAFRNATHDGSVSIYMLSEASMYTGDSDRPSVISFGPSVRTHRRHFLQQSEYTMCVIRDELDMQFAPHESGIRNEDHLEEQPSNFALFKFDLPARDRSKVLKLLDAYNLNAYSLFGSEESLMETLAARELT